MVQQVVHGGKSWQGRPTSAQFRRGILYPTRLLQNERRLYARR